MAFANWCYEFPSKWFVCLFIFLQREDEIIATPPDSPPAKTGADVLSSSQLIYVGSSPPKSENDPDQKSELKPKNADLVPEICCTRSGNEVDMARSTESKSEAQKPVNFQVSVGSVMPQVHSCNL